MKKINDFADSFERKAMVMIYKIRRFFSPKSVKQTTDKIQEVTKEYQELINEFKLIEEGKSTKSRSERDLIKARVIHLIEKGHISVSSRPENQVQESNLKIV